MGAAEVIAFAAPGVMRRPFDLLRFHARLRADWTCAVAQHNAQVCASSAPLRSQVLELFTPGARRLAR